MEREHKIGLLMAAVTALSWAGLAISLKVASKFASSGNIVWVRMMVASTCMILYFLLSKKQQHLKILKRPPLLALICGALLSANYFGFMKGVELTNASNAQIVIQLGPLLLMLFGIVIFKEGFSRKQLLGLAVAAGGYTIFYWQQIVNSLTHVSQYLKGNTWIVIAALTWSLFAALQKLLSKKWLPQQINLCVFLVSSLLLFPLAQIQEIFELKTWQLILLFALGINTIIAYGALGEALKRAPASQVSVIVTLNPILTLALVGLLGWIEVSWYEPETMSPLAYFGALLILSGVVIVVTNKREKIAIKSSS